MKHENWQPISTAPKDGTEILVWDGSQMTVARWGYSNGLDSFAVGMGRAPSSEPEWIYGDSFGKFADHATTEATHWMPLPDKPE